MMAMQIMTIMVAAEDDPGVASWFWVVLSMHLVGVLGYTGYRVAVRYRAPRDGCAGQR